MRRLTNFFKKTHRSFKSLQQKVKTLHPKPKQKVSKPTPQTPSKPESMVVHLSSTSIARATAVILLLIVLAYLIFEIRSIILIFFVAFLFSSALDPTVDKWEEKRIPRPLSIILIYLILFAFLALFISNFIPLIAEQILELASRAGEIITNITTNGKSDLPFADKLKPFIDQFFESVDSQTMIEGVQTALAQVGEQLKSVAGNAFKALSLIFRSVFNVVLVFVLTFFMTMEEQGIQKFIQSLFPSKYSQYILQKSDAVKEKIGAWIKGQLMLSLAVGSIIFIGLSIINIFSPVDIKYTATLAMIAALTEFIPYIGPMLAAIPAILIGLNISPFLVLWIIFVYWLTNWLENNFLVPVIMKKAVGISPVIILFAMLTGFHFLKIVGILLAVPVTTIVWIFLRDYSEKKK